VPIDPAQDLRQKNVRLLGDAANPPTPIRRRWPCSVGAGNYHFHKLITGRHAFGALDDPLVD
jgi:hypothetical protein